jgi:hypothetical protein
MKFGLKRKENFGVMYNWDEIWKTSCKVKKPDTKDRYYMILLCDIPRIVKFRKIESIMILYRAFTTG